MMPNARRREIETAGRSSRRLWHFHSAVSTGGLREYTPSFTRALASSEVWCSRDDRRRATSKRPPSRGSGTWLRHGNGLDIGPDGSEPERENYGDVLLLDRLRAAIAKLNPTLDAETRAEVLAKLRNAETPSLIAENRRLHRYLVEGVPVEVRRPDGTVSGEQARLIDFDDPDANDWLAVNQFRVIENHANRRPDVVIFVNGLPLAVIELKNPGDENATIDGAFHQLQTYKSQIGSLFRTNAALMISDGLAARIGSLTADRERFMPWRTISGDDLAPKGTPELETVLKGVFDAAGLLDFLKDYIVFGDTGRDVVKILAGYHQFHAVRPRIASSLRASPRPRSPTWAFARPPRRSTFRASSVPFAATTHRCDLAHPGARQELADGVLRRRDHQAPEDANPTLGLLTDRNDLDDQLFATFSMCKDLLRQTPMQAEDRDHLRDCWTGLPAG